MSHKYRRGCTIMIHSLSASKITDIRSAHFNGGALCCGCLKLSNSLRKQTLAHVENEYGYRLVIEVRSHDVEQRCVCQFMNMASYIAQCALNSFMRGR